MSTLRKLRRSIARHEGVKVESFAQRKIREWKEKHAKKAT